jgi:alkyl sulfatase BDS1-like metallo-beta-lactamase superfamily hydrolase
MLGQRAASADIVRAMTVPMWFDYLAVRLNADKAAGRTMTINWIFTDLHEKYAMTLSNSAISYLADTSFEKPSATVTLTREAFNRIAAMQGKPGGGLAALKDLVSVTGQQDALAALFGMLDSFSPGFDIVTPVNMPSPLPADHQ